MELVRVGVIETEEVRVEEEERRGEERRDDLFWREKASKKKFRHSRDFKDMGGHVP